jgi:hypothetical protein
LDESDSTKTDLSEDFLSILKFRATISRQLCCKCPHRHLLFKGFSQGVVIPKIILFACSLTIVTNVCLNRSCFSDKVEETKMMTVEQESSGKFGWKKKH